MRVRINRGAHEIGGNCIEVEAKDGKRIVLDVGRPLSAGFEEAVSLPEVAGFRAEDPLMLGVVVSHLHLDHVGLVPLLPSHVPVLIGEEATRVLEAASFFTPHPVHLTPSEYLRDHVPISLGPFIVTPILMDHSGYDAYCLVIDADGKRLFYSGDVRAHGRKGALFERLLREPPSDIDVLLIEGTHVRSAQDARDQVQFETEDELELRMAELFKSTEGLVAVAGSAQNIDRLVTVFRACIRSHRRLAVDLYTATVAAATRETIPQVGFDGLHVFVPWRQRARVKRLREFGRTDGVRKARLFPEQMKEQAPELVFYGPSSTLDELVDCGALDGTGLAIWSLWTGYLADGGGRRLKDMLANAAVPLEVMHTSGHAAVVDLQRMVVALEPARVVPIHTEASERFSELFPRVEVHADGEWWDV